MKEASDGVISDWIVSDWTSVGLVLASAVLTYIAVTVCVRLLGLRSFSKMSSTDFVTTVAIGSLMAGVISAPSPSLAIGLASLLSIFVIKWAIAVVRRRTNIANVLLDNQPIFLMEGSQILHENLEEAKMSVSELHAKLRQANVWNYNQVVHVVLETTGDVSVLSRSKDDSSVLPAIFQDVRG